MTKAEKAHLDAVAEEWRPVAGWEGLYEVSSFGCIRSFDRYVRFVDKKGNDRKRKIKGRVLKQVVDSKGYYFVAFNDAANGRSKQFRVHRVIAEAFLPNDENKPHINHKDCNKKNNEISNLEWCTHAENLRHASLSGRMGKGGAKGSKNSHAKLTEDQAVEIKSMLKRGFRACEIAKSFPVGQNAITNIKMGWAWKHIEI